MKNRAVVAVVVACVAALVGGAAEAKRSPSSISVCIDSESGVVSRIGAGEECNGTSQTWSASSDAPVLCWNTSSLLPASRTRVVTLAGANGCNNPLQTVPNGKVTLLCADQASGALHWPVTKKCGIGNVSTWVRVGSLRTTATPSSTIAPTPIISLNSTVIRGNTWPKAVTVTTNIAGTVYFVEGSIAVNSVSDITNAHSLRWAKGSVKTAGIETAIDIDVDSLLNGYYRVFLVTAQGVLSAPANNLVTISVTRAYETSNNVVRTQTLDQNQSTWHVGNWYTGLSSTQSMGQSFTAGLSGPLSRISVGLTRSGTVTQVTADIYASDGSGNATGSVLATKTITGNVVPTTSGGSLTDFDFATPYSVTAGTKYVIVLTTPDRSTMGGGGQYSWFNLNGNGYTGGNGISSPLSSPSTSSDFVFQTYVDI